MSKNSQDGSDEIEVIFDGASTENDGPGKEKYDVIDVEIQSTDELKSDDFELSDSEDTEEGIFAPERREKKSPKKSSSLMVAVSVLALVGVGAFVYTSNPDIFQKVAGNFSGDTSVTVPDESVATENPTSMVDPMNLTAIDQSKPDDVTPTSPVEGSAPVVENHAAEGAVVTPPNEIVVEGQPLVNEVAQDNSNPSTSVEEHVVTTSNEGGETDPAQAVDANIVPSKDESAVSIADSPLVAADSDTIIPTTEGLSETSNNVTENPAVAPNVEGVSPSVSPAIVPQATSEKISPAPDILPVVEEAAQAPVIEDTPLSTSSEVKKVEEVKGEASSLKPTVAQDVKKENVVEEKPVIVASKEEKKVIDDANLDKYFDSPGGKILKDIPAPSMDPKKGSRESIIIVNKKTQKSDAASMPNVKSGKVSIETTSLAAQTVSANRAMKLGRYEAAKEMYNELYRLNPKDGQILSGRALLLQKMGFADQAIAAYEELLQLYPDNTDAIVNLSGLIRKQYPAVALGKLLDLHMAHPNNVYVTAQLGVAYADAGNFDDALRYLEMAASMDPQNAQHFYNMAVISEKASKRDQAIRYYEKALDVDTIYGEGKRTISREKIYDRLAIIRGN